MKRLLLISGIIFVAVFILLTVFPTKKTKIPRTPRPQQKLERRPQKTPPSPAFKNRAVSLRVLQQRTQNCIGKGKCPETILKLCGLTKVDGFVIDEKHKDIILFGKPDATLPALHLEDFVIALRNVWLKYALLKGDTYYYSPPGCSIDMSPETIQRLQEVSKKIFSASEKVEKSLKKWHAVCSQPQKVRVLGIPFNSRFAKVTVDADYYMKRLVDGSVSLGIHGLTSLTDMTLAKAEKDMLQGRPVSVPSLCMNRFWFFPGKNEYLEDNGVVLLKQCQIKLLTEEEFLTESNKVAGKGRPNPSAKKFAEDFTDRYREIAQRKPIYAELEGLFRFVALAKIMKYKNTPSEAKLDLTYFLNHFPLSKTAVNHTLPGLSHVKRVRHKQELTGGYRIATRWFSNCGGVSIDIRVDKENFIEEDKSGKLQKLRSIVLNARPSPDALSWDFPSPKMWNVKLKNIKKSLLS